MGLKSSIIAGLAVMAVLAVASGTFVATREPLTYSGPSYEMDAEYTAGNESVRLEFTHVDGPPEDPYPVRGVWVGVKPATLPANSLNTTRATVRSGGEVSENGTWMGDGGLRQPPLNIGDSFVVASDATDRDNDGNRGIEPLDRVIVMVEFTDDGRNRTTIGYHYSPPVE